MIKVVIDANVFASAIIKPEGKPAKILDLAKAEKVKLVISQAILKEIQRILFYPRIKKFHRFTPKSLESFLKELCRGAEVTPGLVQVKAVRDPDDDMYVACAMEGQADYIVSGDRDLTDLKSYQGIPIIPPAHLLEILAEPAIKK